MPRTIDNLIKMFTSGSESYVRYMAFAEGADKEGHANAAKILRAVAMSKMRHSVSHLRAANLLDKTMENLKQALEEETYDYKNAYPSMVQEAVKEEAINGRYSLEYAMSIGPIITKFISKAIGDPDGQEEGSYYVCPVCGYIQFGNPPDKCPYCGVDGKNFVEVS